MYADDVVVIAAPQRAQAGLDRMGVWAKGNRQTVSLEPGKSCWAWFPSPPTSGKSTGLRKTAPPPPPPAAGYSYGSEALCTEPNPNMLGVRFDESLSFLLHVKTARRRMVERSELLQQMTSPSWGCSLKATRALYLATSRSLAGYAIEAYGPRVDPKHLAMFELAQHRAAENIIGCPRWSRRAAMLREADLPPISSLVASGAAPARKGPPPAPGYAIKVTDQK